jgi:putative ABC transport system substrate-binding protein
MARRAPGPRTPTGRSVSRTARTLLRGLAPSVVLLFATGQILDHAVSADRTGLVKIGALTESWGPTPAMVGLRDGLMALGYRDGEQFVIGVRFTQGDIRMLPTAAEELVKNGADILFASGTNAAKAAQLATTRLPIVFAEAMNDPVETGLVQSIARPGGNITGVTNLDLDLAAKRLEILKEMLPGLKRVMVPYDSSDAHGLAAARLYRDAARQLGIVLEERALRTQEEARASLASVRKSEVDGIISTGSMALNIPGFILEATARHQLPTMFNGAFWVERGALVSYGPDFYESGRQAARLVDKILKGESPARIPVETNPRIELTINVKVAKALRLQVAPAVLQRANRLIE